MRIVAGEHRGRTLAVPDGLDTRPTTDRVREAVMSSVFSKLGGFEGAYVLDAFSGTGAMGLEAMSRGAEGAVLNDFSTKSRACIEENASSLGYRRPDVRITSVDVLNAGIPGGSRRYSLIFLDPPYATSQVDVARILAKAEEDGLLADNCLVVYEHDAPADENIWVSQFGDDQLSYGDVCDSPVGEGETMPNAGKQIVSNVRIAPFAILDEKRYGKTYVTYLRPTRASDLGDV